MSMEVSNEVKVKNEPICDDSQSITQFLAMKVKEEPIEIEMQTSEEKFSAREEFSNKISIAFFNEETTTTISNSQPNKPRENKSKDQRRYKCNICNKNFNCPSNLITHQRIHTGERPFECDTCKKRFTQSSSLFTHRKTHTGERPYECEICKKTFSRFFLLERHKRVHSGEKPYQCEICQKSFNQSSGLGTHRKTHNREKP